MEQDRDIARLLRSGRTVLGALVDLAGQRPDVREALRELARWVEQQLDAPADELERAETDQPPVAPVERRRLAIGDGFAEVDVLAPTDGARSDGAAAPAIGSPEPAAPRESGPPVEEPPVDLVLVARRARLKARACRWAIERRRLVAARADHEMAIKPTDNSLLDAARAMPFCIVWMLDPYHVLPPDDALEQAAGCYEALADAADLAGEADPVAPDEALPPLVAEAQSALLAAMGRCDVVRDQDQAEMFRWLRDLTQRHRILLERHMKRDDPADHAGFADLRRRIERYRAQRAERRADARRRNEMRKRVRYHLGRLPGRDQDEALHHWNRILQTLTEWVDAGNRPSDRHLCDHLREAAERVPPEVEVTPQARRVLDAVQARHEAEHALREAAPAPPSVTPEHVREAAGLLAGRVAVFIGGEARPEHERALREALRLRELRWVATTPHQPLADLEAEVIRPDVDLVILGIRWTSHSFGQLRLTCDRYGKPLVRLPGGYNASQVAHQVLEQVGDQLRRAVAVG